MFSEKTDVPLLPNQFMVVISVMKLWPWKLGQGHLISCCSCPIYIACKFGNIPSNGPWDNMQTKTFWLKFGGLSLAVTLKIRSRLPKPIQLSIMSICNIHVNLVKLCRSWDIVHTSTFWLKFGSFSPAVTLKIGQGVQNQISSLSCPSVIFMQIWLKSADRFMRYGAHKHFLA